MSGVPRKPIPKPSILDKFEMLGTRRGRKVWRDTEHQRYYTWDGLHGEVEAFDYRGRHLGAFDPISGVPRKRPAKGRKLRV